MHEEIVDGDPCTFDEQAWVALKGVILKHQRLIVSFRVSLPPIGVGDYDRRVTAMTGALKENLNRLFAHQTGVTIRHEVRTGGPRAKVGYIISLGT